MAHKRITVIITSLNDLRIVEAIASVRRFDDVDGVRLLIVDGGSKPETHDLIIKSLRHDDIFIQEKDQGIFDGLNKALDRCDTEFIGWLGSDDRFSGQVLASEVVHALESHELYIANIAFFRDGRILRITHSLPARLGLVKFGLHNPHYATFGRASLLKSERFDLNLMGSDVDYFHKIFKKKPSVATTSKVATLQLAGGFSNASYSKIFRVNLQLLSTYAKHNNVVVAPFLILLKLSYKIVTSMYFKLFPLDLRKIEK